MTDPRILALRQRSGDADLRAIADHIPHARELLHQAMRLNEHRARLAAEATDQPDPGGEAPMDDLSDPRWWACQLATIAAEQPAALLLILDRQRAERWTWALLGVLVGTGIGLLF